MAISAPFPYRHCLRPLSHGLRRASSPIGGAKGGCAAGFPPTCPLRHRISFANVRWCHCRRSAPTLFPPWGNNRADNIRPYERSEITPAVIQWHRPCRGGYQPPANVANLWAEPYWPNRGSDVAKCTVFRHCTVQFCRIMFDTALSAQCADVVSPMGKQPGG